MVLNYIWIAFFLIAFAIAVGKTLLCGDLGVWSDIMNASFTSASTAFELALGLTGVLSLWLGLMKIGERAGVIQLFGRAVSPLFTRLFPGVPKNHPAMGSIFMNISANMLGLDNAATPLGLKAMQQLQELNTKKDTATDAMIMFLVLNASGLCLIPISIIMYRAQAGAAKPHRRVYADTRGNVHSHHCGHHSPLPQAAHFAARPGAAGMAGRTQRSGGRHGVVFALHCQATRCKPYSSFVANALLLTVITGFLLAGLRKKLNMYETFIEGAKEGFKTAVPSFPIWWRYWWRLGCFAPRERWT